MYAIRIVHRAYKPEDHTLTTFTPITILRQLEIYISL